MRKSKLREFQDGMQNHGWRIKMIPHDDPSRPMRNPSNPLATILFFVFVVAIVLMFTKKKESYGVIAIVAFAMMCFSMLAGGILRRIGWKRVRAVCLDKEIGNIGRTEWELRLRCRFELDGKPYTVTPTFLSSYGSEKEVEDFLRTFIASDGTCTLSVNPRNPLQAEIVGHKTAAILNQQ